MDNIVNEKFEIYIKKSEKTLIKILNDHLNKLLINNVNINYICKVCDIKKILFINYTIKKTDNKINIYEFNNNIKKRIKQIDKLSDLDNYSFIGIYIKSDGSSLYNVFTCFDFKKMIKDVEAILFIKIILSLKGISIDNIFRETKFYNRFPFFNRSPIEIFYEEVCILGKEYNIINNEYNFNIKFLNKCRNKKVKKFKKYLFNICNI